jgi:hypothetical protein
MNQLASEGTGAGWDAALMLTGPWKFLPSITAVAHDVGNTYFNLGAGYFYKTATRPPPQYQSIDAGFGLFPILSKRIRMSIAGEYRDVQNPETLDMFRRIHAGVEFDFGDIFFARGGMNQRYYTAGIELAIASQQLQLTTYGEEIGTATVPREDRRFIVMDIFCLLFFVLCSC